jgi:hypothetical protein
MKKLITQLILLGNTLILAGIPKAFADCEAPATQEEKINCLFPSEDALISASPQGGGGNSLPSGDLTTDFLPFFINTLTSIAGTLIFVALVYAGYLLVFVNDEEEKIEKAKKIISYCFVGAIIIATSYAIIYGVANLDLD